MKKITNYKLQITNKLELSFASLRTWNDGMLEKWNDGMASFGQINACGVIKLSIVNYQLSIVNETSTHGLLRDLNYKQITKGGHGLHKDSSRLQTMTAFYEKFLRGGVNQWVSESVGQCVSASVGKGLLERSLVTSHWALVSELRRLKDSIPFLQTNSNELYNIQHFDAFSAGSVHLKKPSGGPKGLIGPPCHGALAVGGKSD
ncbi:MAG: hypothetical protein PVH61_01420 [Candidatus Aminicenantes bacterium]|jgi:hypothetical protein